MNTRKKITLHLAYADKFIEPFIEFVEQNFDDFHCHVFVILGCDPRYKIKIRNNVFLVSSLGGIEQYFLIAKYMQKAEKIILHGLFGKFLLLFLFHMPWVLRKCYWIIWGGDLYYHDFRKKSFKSNAFEILRKIVIKRIGHLVTYIKGDVELARKWYGASGKYHECLMYPSNTYKEYTVPPKVGNTVNIQIGNSADPSNQHFEIFDMLERYHDEDIQIFAPLSYGDKAYALRVAEEGKRLFGDKFTPLLELMPFDEYLKFLGQIDVAIFNHKRQQAMGNTITLLGLGKKVYMRTDVSQWRLFTKMGIKVFNINKLSLDTIEAEVKALNNKKVTLYFSKKTLVDQYLEIFR